MKLGLENQTNKEFENLEISKDEWEKVGGGVERCVFVSMLVVKVVGCQIEASFQKEEWESKSETHSLSAGAMRTRYLAFD